MAVVRDLDSPESSLLTDGSSECLYDGSDLSKCFGSSGCVVCSNENGARGVCSVGKALGRRKRGHRRCGFCGRDGMFVGEGSRRGRLESRCVGGGHVESTRTGTIIGGSFCVEGALLRSSPCQTNENSAAVQARGRERRGWDG